MIALFHAHVVFQASAWVFGAAMSRTAATGFPNTHAAYSSFIRLASPPHNAIRQKQAAPFRFTLHASRFTFAR
jgi:hypothetical protein